MVKEEVEKVPIGKIDKHLVDKAKGYKALTGVAVVGLVEDLLADFFKDKVVNPTFITLDKPLYFNYTELIEKGRVKASTVKPISNLEEVAIVKKVPVNLDKFEPELKTYCYNKQANLHKGIYIYHKLYWNVYVIDKVVDDILIFQYDLKANELEIGLVNDVKLLDLYVDDNSEENKALLKGLLEEAEVFTKTINDNYNYYDDVYEYSANIESVFKSFEVIEAYTQKRRFTGQLDLNNEIKSYLLNNNPDLKPEEISDSDLASVFKQLMKDNKVNEKIITELIETSNSLKKELEAYDEVISRLNSLEENLNNEEIRSKTWQELKE